MNELTLITHFNGVELRERLPITTEWLLTEEQLGNELGLRDDQMVDHNFEEDGYIQVETEHHTYWIEEDNTEGISDYIFEHNLKESK